MQKGKFIVIYGTNNLGKTTQVKILIEKLQQEGYPAEYLKYPPYDLEPSGPILNDYLRKGNPYQLNPREIQIVQVINRTQFEPVIKNKLNQGINIIAEDYTGTGLAWGIGTGVNEKFLKKINFHLLKEDLAILLHGQRFSDGIEKGHHNEENQELIEKVRQVHENLADELNWIKVNANQTIEQVAKEIWGIVSARLK